VATVTESVIVPAPTDCAGSAKLKASAAARTGRILIACETAEKRRLIVVSLRVAPFFRLPPFWSAGHLQRWHRRRRPGVPTSGKPCRRYVSFQQGGYVG